MRFEADVKVSGNIISGRQGVAYVYNSNKIVNLVADMDLPQKYDTYKVFGKAKVAWTYRGRENGSVGTLEMEDGRWFIGSGGCCLADRFTFEDVVELVENSQAPLLHEGHLVAITLLSKNNRIASTQLYKCGKVNIHCMEMAELIPLTEDEMLNVVADVKQWCS